MYPVDNQFIKNKILASVALIEAIPSLRTYKAKIADLEKACGTCGGGPQAAKELNEVWNELRKFLAELPDDQKQIIRDRVSPQRALRISYRVGSGNNTSFKGSYL